METGLTCEERMIARPSPRSVPRAMLASVRKIVSIRPRRMDSWVKYWATTPHLKLGLVRTETRIPMPARMLRIHPAYSERVRSRSRGFRAASMLLIVASLPLLVAVTMVAPRLVQLGFGDGPGVQAPGLEGLLVLRSFQDGLERRLHGRGQRRALLQADGGHV